MPATAIFTESLKHQPSSDTSVKPVASPPERSSDGEQRLDSLTSLRFFAAAMIVILHLSQLFGFNSHSCLEGLALWQGVSFFFVLSGFILAYVYPRIDTPAQSNKFLLARFARIWPTHFAAFTLTLFLVPAVLNIHNLIPTAIANLCMVQVWAFQPALNESFNSVSWTISIELFFYLCFPFLIKDFDRSPKLRWIGATVLSLSFILLCMLPYAVASFAPGTLTPSLFMGENPICRLFEFTLGIFACWCFKKRPLSATINKSLATALELTALTAIAFAISLSNFWPAQAAPGALSVLRAFAIDMGGAPAYGALIYLIACEKGAVAQFLKKKVLVRLGEISFSLYMYHLSILYVLVHYQSSFANLPGWMLPSVGFLVCLIVSHLNFTFIETPARQAIMGALKGSTTRGGSNRGGNQPDGNSASAAAVWWDELIFSAPIPNASAFATTPRFALSGMSGSVQRALNPGLSLDEFIFSAPLPSKYDSATPSAMVRRSAAADVTASGIWLDDLIFSAPVPNPVASSGITSNAGLASSFDHAWPNKPTYGIENQSATSTSPRSRQTWLIAELAALCLIVTWLNVQFRFIPPGTAERIVSHSLPTARDIEFGGRFKLQGLKLSRKPDGLHVNAVWESLGAQRLKYVNAVHIIDPYGKTLSTKIYPQDTFNRTVDSGKIWEDKIDLRPDELKGALRLGISLYAPPDGKPLPANQGTRDGNNVRFLVAIPN